jgi:hypothetical protein
VGGAAHSGRRWCRTALCASGRARRLNDQLGQIGLVRGTRTFHLYVKSGQIAFCGSIMVTGQIESSRKWCRWWQNGDKQQKKCDTPVPIWRG